MSDLTALTYEVDASPEYPKDCFRTTAGARITDVWCPAPGGTAVRIATERCLRSNRLQITVYLDAAALLAAQAATATAPA